MPEVYNKDKSTDIYVYNLANFFSERNCYLNPNWVTAIGFLITVILLFLFYYNKHYLIILYLTIIRSILDLLDGSVARKCNKISKEGKIYDFLNDLFFYIAIPFLTFLIIPDKYYIIKFCIIIVFFSVLLSFFKTNNKGFSTIGIIFHDNYILSSVLYISSFYFLKEFFY